MAAPSPTHTPVADLVRRPARASALSEWALLPLRLFLGVTFLYAGIQKLSNPHFFDASSSSSIQAQFAGSVATSPLGSLLHHLQGGAVAFGAIIALSEVAIGLGTLVGLLSRTAAFGGVVLSSTLFLTVSFHSTPYFTGADIVFFFAWMPLVIAPGGRLSLDGWIARRAHEEAGEGDPSVVPVTFATVRTVCGAYQDGHCSARTDHACIPGGCPFLEGTLNPAARNSETIETAERVSRRAVMLTATSAGIATGAGVVIAGAAVGAGRVSSSKTTGTTQLTEVTTTTSPHTTTTMAGETTTTVPPGVNLGPASAVAVNSSASFTLSTNGDPGLVIHTTDGKFVAYDATCPHAGCPVGYQPSMDLIVCGCHGSQFQPSTGEVVQGPAQSGLTALTITEANGNLYVQE